MTIYIVSPGRSGSGWLAVLFAGVGMRVAHEWYGTQDIPDVVADTSYLWNQDTFLSSLGNEDIIIVLDRPEEERTKSVNKLLGDDKDWTELENQWGLFKAKLKSVPNITLWIKYKDLMSRETKEQIFSLLFHYTGASTGNFEEMWGLLKNMRVTNLTAEREVLASYDK